MGKAAVVGDSICKMQHVTVPGLSTEYPTGTDLSRTRGHVWERMEADQARNVAAPGWGLPFQQHTWTWSVYYGKVELSKI